MHVIPSLPSLRSFSFPLLALEVDDDTLAGRGRDPDLGTLCDVGPGEDEGEGEAARLARAPGRASRYQPPPYVNAIS